VITVGPTEAKAIENNFFVGQERWLGDQNRLETDVVQAVNDSFQRIFLKGCLSLVGLCDFILANVLPLEPSYKHPTKNTINRLV